MAKSAQILIVEETETRDSLAAALQREGYQTSTAANGQEVLSKVEHGHVDAIVAGIRMPGMNGRELLRRVGAHGGGVAVILLADPASQDAALAAVREGAFDYLLKPLDDVGKVLQTVARALEWREQLARDAGLLAKKAVVSTGNMEIDNKMGGGIPLGSLTLIEGSSHAGKSVLSQQMMWGSLHDGFRLSFLTTENTVKSLVTQMQSLNTDILDYLLLRRLRVYPMEIARSNGGDLNALLEAIRSERARSCDIVFVDALTPFILSTPPEQVIGFFEGVKRICSDGMTIVNVIHSHAVSSELLVRITSLCDAHLCLRTEEVGAKLVKVMEVSKIRGASKNTGNIVSFEVEPGLGMRIIPISKAQG